MWADPELADERVCGFASESVGSGYKLFVLMYSQQALRIEHYMQKRAGGTARAIHAN